MDDPGFQRTLVHGLLKDDFGVAGEPENGAEAVEPFGETRPDLVTTDITTREHDDTEATSASKDRDSVTRAVTCTGVERHDRMPRAVQTGAVGSRSRARRGVVRPAGRRSGACPGRPLRSRPS